MRGAFKCFKITSAVLHLTGKPLSFKSLRFDLQRALPLVVFECLV
jgi:hypothetical protein